MNTTKTVSCTQLHRPLNKNPTAIASLSRSERDFLSLSRTRHARISPDTWWGLGSIPRISWNMLELSGDGRSLSAGSVLMDAQKRVLTSISFESCQFCFFHRKPSVLCYDKPIVLPDSFNLKPPVSKMYKFQKHSQNKKKNKNFQFHCEYKSVIARHQITI